MPLNIASPGYVIKEIDLTLARATPSSNKTGALVSPFEKGPVGTPVLVESESDLLNIFGKPYSYDNHYENWFVASSYLSYGGSLRIVRSDGNQISNAFVGSATSIKINSVEDYYNKEYDQNNISNVTMAAKNPGSWGNGLVVAIIDAKADQIINVPSSTSVSIGASVLQSIPTGTVIAGVGTTSIINGFFKGIVTGVTTTSDGTQKELEVKVLALVNGSTETKVDYQPRGVYKFTATGTSGISTVITVAGVGTTAYSEKDWFDQQKITVSTGINTTSLSTIYWNELVPRPATTAYAEARGSKYDEMHVIVIDGNGTITGNSSNILEKFTNLSKCKDATFSSGSPSNWKKYLADNSSYIFGGGEPDGVVATGFYSGYNLATNGSWDTKAEGNYYECIGAKTYILDNGTNYNGTKSLSANGALSATISDLSSGYNQFENTDNFKVDFILMGSAAQDKERAQSLANKIISIAELRKDAIAFISPYKSALLSSNGNGVTINDSETITNNIISFYSPITSSSYAVFDSGYKYTYDRFGDTFRYIPLNGDIAGTCARTDINNFPWYSPAGNTRGAILNAIKLAYNPSKSQRDRLYSNRINPVIFSPGSGIILYGDKTGLARSSAFDRINVRRLFIYLETAISSAAKDVLFEFNDEITRTNFVNTIEPFLRDVTSKRGIYDYIVICDETNNTASVIDNNEFIADIYIKPAKSVNYVGLTFIATKTGVNFEEIIGNF